MAKFSITRKPVVTTVDPAKPETHKPGEFGTVISEVVEAAPKVSVQEQEAKVVATVAAHGDRKHHRRSPSSLQHREICEGWETREGETNAAAEAGTLQHEAADTGDHDPLDDEQALAVLSCVEYVAQIAAFLGPGALEIREEYLTVDKEETTAGYLDRGIINAERTEAHIVDFKFGAWLVEKARNNLQGIAYGLGLVHRFPTIQRFHVHFLMPHIGEEGTVDTATFERSEFEHLLLRIRTVVEKSARADKIFVAARSATGPDERAKLFSQLRLNPTDGGCLFCGRKAECPAINGFALSVSPKYAPLMIPDLINPALITDPDDCAKALKFFSVMEGLAKDYRAAVSNKALNSENWMPTGYYLTAVSRRSIVDKVKFKQALKDRGLTEDQITACTSFTFGPVEKLISEAAPRGEKEAAVEEFAQALEAAGAVQKGEPFPVLKMSKAAPMLKA